MISPKHLHEQTLKAVKIYKNAEFEIINLLMQNSQTRAYLSLGYPSLHVYCTKGLRLSDAVAYSLTSVARKSQTIPEIKQLIKEEKLTLSNATQVSRVITEENKADLLSLAQSLSKRELEKEIKRIHPDAIPKERVRVLTTDLEELKIVMNKELAEDLKFLRDFYAKKRHCSLSLSETLIHMASELREKHDPIRKATRNFVPGTKSVKVRSGRITLPASLKHPVQLRDKGRCSHHYQDGTRCENTRYLEIHHIKPLAKGGTNTLENLTTLCSGHHSGLHRSRPLRVG